MKKKLFIMGMVVALVAVLVVPLAVSASPPSVVISGSLTATTPPSYTTPLYDGATSVSGTSTPGAAITVTVNGTPYNTTADGSGNWTVSPISPAMSTGNTISVIAQSGS